MCGRYALHAHPDVVALEFALGASPQFKASYNICPGTAVLVVGSGAAGERTAGLARWGFGGRLANARGETVADKPAFRNAFRQRRCLVPASGFYEWQAAGGRRQPWYIRPAGAGLFGLAGIAECGDGMMSMCLITTAPNALMKSIHERMPLIVAPQDYRVWLDRENEDASLLRSLVRPCPAELMDAYPVGPRVNTPKNDDPALIEALDKPR